MKLFVYGTLKRGQRLNQYLGNSNFIETGIARNFSLYTNGSYPYMLEDQGGVVHGEIFEVNNAVVMTQLRSIEREYSEEIIQVETVDGIEDCYAYVYMGDIREYWTKIDNGNFNGSNL